MYSNVVYASLWMAMNGFSESMVEEVPSRNTPPSLTALLLLLLPPPALAWCARLRPPDPPPQAASTSVAPAAASRAAGLCLPSPLIGSPITRYFLDELIGGVEGTDEAGGAQGRDGIH